MSNVTAWHAVRRAPCSSLSLLTDAPLLLSQQDFKATVCGGVLLIANHLHTILKLRTAQCAYVMCRHGHIAVHFSPTT